MNARRPPAVECRFESRLVLSAIMSLIAWPLAQMVTATQSIPWSSGMREAAVNMEQALAAVAAYCDSSGIAIDEALDPNRTCLIGPEYTPLFTSLGQLEAKRTTTNPDMAGLLAYLLQEAGVSAGDTIAVGASGSFPALLVATLTAAAAMGVHPLVIVSLGASSYGATRPTFNVLDLYELLLTLGLVESPPEAASLGGSWDAGTEFDPALRKTLRAQIRRFGVPLIHATDVKGSIEQRMAVYLGPERERRVAAFVNIGGNAANLGTSPVVLNLAPGLSLQADLPPPDRRGVLYRMAAQGVPVIHLLHVRGLTRRFGMPWDPVPLPEPGVNRLFTGTARSTWRFWAIALAYLASLVAVARLGGRRDTAASTRRDAGLLDDRDRPETASAAHESDLLAQPK